MELGQHAGQHAVRRSADEADAYRADPALREVPRAFDEGVGLAQQAARFGQQRRGRRR